MSKNKKIIALLSVVLFSVFSHWRWFTFKIFSYNDAWYLYRETEINFLEKFAKVVWSPLDAFGSVFVEPYFYPFFLAQGLIAQMGFSYEVSFFVIRLFPIVILSAVGSFYFVSLYVKNYIYSIIGSLFYITSTYFLALQSEHLTIALAYSIAPLLLFFYIKLLVRVKDSNGLTFESVLFLAFIIFSQIIVEPRVFYVLFIVYATLPFLYGVWNKRVFFNLIFFSLFIFLLLSAYWMLPMFQTGGDQIMNLVDRPLFGSQFKSILHSLSTYRETWTGEEPINFSIQPINPLFFIIPILAFFSLFGKNRKILFWGLMACVGIFLAKQDNKPLGDIYIWLFNNVPGFNLFRESSKFNILTNLSFSVLLAFSMSFLYKNIKARFLYYPFIFLIIFIFSINTIPLVNGSFGSLFIGRNIHGDYLVFKDKIISENSFYRILAIPTKDRWIYHNVNNPRVGAIEMITDVWEKINKEYYSSPELKIASFFNHNYIDFVFDIALIKYVVVPIRDVDNDNDYFKYYGGVENPNIRDWYVSVLDKLDYLKKIDIGAKELAVYENKDYKPYIFSVNRLIGLKTFEKLEDKYSFINDELNKDFLFYGMNKKEIVSDRLFVPYENISVDKIYDGILIDSTANSNASVKIHKNQSKQNLVLENGDGEILLKKVLRDNVNVNKYLSATTTETEIFRQKILNSDVFVELGTQLLKVQIAKSLDLGIVTKPINLLLVEQENSITNSSFEEGAWSEQVGDCYAYDDKPILSMEISDESVDDNSSIQLEASSHIACTGQDNIQIKGGEDYLFAFDYQSPNAIHAGYYISFNNSNGIISERLPMDGDKWNHFQKKINMPATSTEISLVIYSYAKDDKTNVITRYDNFQLKQLKKIATVDPGYKPIYEKTELVKADEYEIEYKEEGLSFDNLIRESSFENGLWADKVGDCNNYDDDGRLSMNQSSDEKSDGQKSLQLGATRHIACTGPGMLPVIEERTYLFSFDYQSPNGKQAGYYLGFNDPEQTVISERIPIKGVEWQNYTKQIKVPYGASAVSLVVYSYAADGKKEIITRYDNFNFIKLPDLEERYYIHSEPEEKFVEPTSIDFELTNPTKKKVHIKGATTPFYLMMSESYHDQWQLQMNNDKINGFFNKWVPWVKPDRVGDDQHFELNGFLNGWMVNTSELCKDNSACTLNADGSYDMEMVVEFFPQRWFYLGLLISGTTLFACLGYLGWYFVGRWRKKREVNIQNYEN